jgi:hypothetical protein
MVDGRLLTINDRDGWKTEERERRRQSKFVLTLKTRPQAVADRGQFLAILVVLPSISLQPWRRKEMEDTAAGIGSAG